MSYADDFRRYNDLAQRQIRHERIMQTLAGIALFALTVGAAVLVLALA